MFIKHTPWKSLWGLWPGPMEWWEAAGPRWGPAAPGLCWQATPHRAALSQNGRVLCPGPGVKPAAEWPRRDLHSESLGRQEWQWCSPAQSSYLLGHSAGVPQATPIPPVIYRLNISFFHHFWPTPPGHPFREQRIFLIHSTPASNLGSSMAPQNPSLPSHTPRQPPLVRPSPRLSLSLLWPHGSVLYFCTCLLPELPLLILPLPVHRHTGTRREQGLGLGSAARKTYYWVLVPLWLVNDFGKITYFLSILTSVT